MGNNLPVIYVHLTESEVLTGSPVRGKVYLDVSDADLLSCESVKLRIVGSEYTEVGYVDVVPAGRDTVTVEKISYGKSTFLEKDHELANFETGVISKGQYEFPFTFVLPKGAPSSMFVSCGYKDKCKIQYTLEAYINRSENTDTSILSHSCNFNVVNRYDEVSPVPWYLEPNKSPLHKCCVYKGDILLGGCTNSCILNPHQEATVRIAVENQSKVNINFIEVSIKEQITFHNKGHVGKGLTTVLFTQRVTPTKDLTPKLSSVSNKKSSNALDKAEDMHIICDKLLSDECDAVQFTLPNTAFNTLHGSMITVRHVLSIQACTSVGINNPIICNNIQIHNHQNVPSNTENTSNASGIQYTSVPNGWKPIIHSVKEFPAVSIRLPSPQLQVENEMNQNESFYTHPMNENEGNALQHNFNELLKTIHSSYTPSYDLELWLQQAGNTLISIPDVSIKSLFTSVRSASEQIQLAGIISKHLHDKITCVLISLILDACRETARREVAEKLLTSGDIADRQEKAGLIERKLNSFQYLTVEKYLK